MLIGDRRPVRRRPPFEEFLEKLETRYNGRVIAIDSSIKNGQYGEVLLIENGKKYRGLPVGNKQPFLVAE